MSLTSHSGEETEAICTANVNYAVTALEIREKQR